MSNRRFSSSSRSATRSNTTPIGSTFESGDLCPVGGWYRSASDAGADLTHFRKARRFTPINEKPVTWQLIKIGSETQKPKRLHRHERGPVGRAVDAVVDEAKEIGGAFVDGLKEGAKEVAHGIGVGTAHGLMGVASGATIKKD